MTTWYAQAGGDWDAVSGGTTSSVWFDAASGGTAMDITGKVSGTTWTDTANTYILNGQAVNLKIATNVSCTILVAAIQAGVAAGTIVVGNSGAVVLGAVGNLCAVSSSYAGVMLTWGTGTCSLTINGSVAYSGGTNTSGMLPLTTGQSITVQNTGGAATTSLAVSGAGYGIVAGGTGAVVISNSGGTAVNNTSTGRAVYMNGGTGALQVTGDVSSSSGFGIYNNSTSASHTLTGNISSSSGRSVFLSAGTTAWTPGSGTNLSVTAGTSTALQVAGTGAVLNVSDAGVTTSVTSTGEATGLAAWWMSNGTINWNGTITLAAGAECLLTMNNGTLNLTSASAQLALANSGTVVIDKRSGTLNVASFVFVASAGSALTVSQGGNTSGTFAWNASAATIQTALGAAAPSAIVGTVSGSAGSYTIRLQQTGTMTLGGDGSITSSANYTSSIVNQSATSYAAIPGGTAAQKAIITGASIPSAADTRYGVTRGWADGGTGATAGCGVAGGNGLLEIPNSDSPTGTQDATSDACVVSGKKYGSPQRTGSAAGGGGRPEIRGANL